MQLGLPSANGIEWKKIPHIAARETSMGPHYAEKLASLGIMGDT